MNDTICEYRRPRGAFLAATALVAALLLPVATAADDSMPATDGGASQAATAPVADPDGLDYADIEVGLPEFDEPFQRDGQLLPPERILQVVRGRTADDVRAALGNPLRTGQGARGPEWDYNLKLDLADHDYLVCQYKVVFDARGGQVVETVWRRYQCRDAIAAHAAGK